MTTKTSWQPPSDRLVLKNDIWQAKYISPVSYPQDGNEVCFQVEDNSYWFAHRNQCILEIIRQFPASGIIYDIGGGNGFVAANLQKAGMNVALVEPGKGALNASKRGVKNVIWSTLEEAAFEPLTLPAAAAFDVVEHIEHDVAFLSSIRSLLTSGGRFYCTVPALNKLWSNEDVYAGHYRRYSRSEISAAFENAGFEVEFASYFFAWLTLPVLLLRALPFHLRGGKQVEVDAHAVARADHHLPKWLAWPVKLAHAWELARFKNQCRIPLGTSLIVVAKAL